MSGWFAIERGITAHPLLKGQPERLALWLWLLDHAAWKPTAFDVKGRLVAVPRGAVCIAVRRLAEEVGVGYQVARTCLKRLESAGMIRIDAQAGTSLVTICGYDKHQAAPAKADRAPNAALTQRQRTKEQGNTSVSEDTGAGAPLDPEAQLLDRGVALLKAAGQSDRSARSLLGRWKKIYGAAAVLAALGTTSRAGAADPVAYCERVLARATGVGDATRFGAFGRIPEVP